MLIIIHSEMKGTKGTKTLYLTSLSNAKETSPALFRINI